MISVAHTVGPRGSFLIHLSGCQDFKDSDEADKQTEWPENSVSVSAKDNENSVSVSAPASAPATAKDDLDGVEPVEPERDVVGTPSMTTTSLRQGSYDEAERSKDDLVALCREEEERAMVHY